MSELRSGHQAGVTLTIASGTTIYGSTVVSTYSDVFDAVDYSGAFSAGRDTPASCSTSMPCWGPRVTTPRLPQK